MVSNDLPSVCGTLFFRFIKPLEHLVHGADEVENGRFPHRLRRQRRHFRLGSLPLETLFPLPSHPPEVISRILEFLVLDELADQIPTRVLLLVLLGKHLQINREQFLALDVHQRGGHDDELAGELEVEPLHQVDVFAELVGQLDHVHLVDIDLFLADEVQQQIQRPLEHFELVSQIAHWTAGRGFSAGTIWWTTRSFQSANASPVVSTPYVSNL